MHGLTWAERDSAWAGIISEDLDVADVRVHVVRPAGDRTAAGTGAEPVLLLHGLGGFAGSWADLLPHLAERGPVVAVDLPGFGATEPPDKHYARPTRLARFVPRLLDTLGWQRAEIHGHSMGGMVATLAAAEFPERVARLVLAAPALPAPRRSALRVPSAAAVQFAPFVIPGLGERAMRLRLRRSSPDGLVRQSVRQLWGDPDQARASVIDLAIDNARYGASQPWRVPAFAASTEELVQLMARPRRLYEAVDAVAAPTLVVWGDADPLITEPVVKGLRSRRGDWVYETVPGAGHQLQLESTDAYLDAVARWRARATDPSILPAHDAASA